MKSNLCKGAVAGQGVACPAALKSDDHQALSDGDGEQLFWTVLTRLHALGDELLEKFHDEKTKNVCVLGTYLVAVLGLAVTLTGLRMFSGLAYFKYYWSLKETAKPQTKLISLEPLPGNAVQTISVPAYWVGAQDFLTYSGDRASLPLKSEPADAPFETPEALANAHCMGRRLCSLVRHSLDDRGSREQQALSVTLTYKKYQFSNTYLSHYFIISAEKYPQLMMNAYTIYVKVDEEAPQVFGARPEHVESLRTLLEEIGAEQPDVHPDQPSECTLWPPGVEPKPQLPPMLLPPPTICPWEATTV
ncbi:hypothetical protein BESB_064530 [Besnoitia besnoiti]|uniref:Uncharacterized protein n=1 Tax=Besnoitia besnoiti TaxID=94643 RepID=A0A2A9MGB3_BESBE|nr:hypothetical protein BESB_064530 [Besnoitia besnoiti]PFH34422.1 hypothetical protein BESB_064530 [Besnoitia besnoiti]